MSTQNNNYIIEKTLAVYFISGIILGIISIIISSILSFLTFITFILIMYSAIQASMISWMFFYVIIIIPNKNRDNIPNDALILIITSSIVFIPTSIISYGIANDWFDDKKSMSSSRLQKRGHKKTKLDDNIIQKKHGMTS